jgi:chromosome segregation ATPase
LLRINAAEVLGKLSAERDHLQQELHRMTQENDALKRDRLEILNEAYDESKPVPINVSAVPASRNVNRSPREDQAANSTAVEALLRERMKRGEERIAQLNEKVWVFYVWIICQVSCIYFSLVLSQLASSEARGELLAHTLKDRESSIALLESDYQRLNIALQSAMEKLSHESATAGDAEARISELSAKQELVTRERVTLRRVVEELREELSAARKEKTDAVLQLENLRLHSSRLEKELTETKDTSQNVIQDFAINNQESIKLKLQVDRLQDEVRRNAWISLLVSPIVDVVAILGIH